MAVPFYTQKLNKHRMSLVDLLEPMRLEVRYAAVTCPPDKTCFDEWVVMVSWVFTGYFHSMIVFFRAVTMDNGCNSPWVMV